MKKKIIATTLCMVFGLSFPLMTHANSCSEDVLEMDDQIAQYGSITTVDQYYITQLKSISGSGTCTASGYWLGQFVCPLTWEMHNWGDTVHCQEGKK